MSYLAALRLHFAGRFQAAPSTVNNVPEHYDNAAFKREYQLPAAGDAANGLWNPRGSADWRLIGCVITGGSYADGTPIDASDPVLTMLVADSDRQVAAKIVDLDPEQQMCSVIWGLEVRLCDARGTTLVRGRFVPAPFTDMWTRTQEQGAKGDVAACAAWQSVMTDLEWGDVAASRLLTELRDAATDGLLSIRFNCDGYNMDPTAPDFTRGRIVGTIGVARATEPRHFVAGRQFMPYAANAPGFFVPAGAINFCSAVVDGARRAILLDLGNALPTAAPDGPLLDLGELTLGYVVPGAAAPTPIATIDYRADAWYERTAGVVDVPVSADVLAEIDESRLALTFARVPVSTLESPGGRYVRADDFVFRLDPGDMVDVRLFATRYGRPYAGAQIVAFADSSGLQGGPPVGAPASAISFPGTVATGPDGRATLSITASEPGNPRGYIDGEIYGVRPLLADTTRDEPWNPWNFISLLVFDAFVPDEPVTWWGSLQPVFQQYANLYPVMDRFLDMSDYDSVCTSRELLRLTFGLDPHEANSMPVTRDLSRSKRDAILRWLDESGPDGKPLLGTPPPSASPSPAPDGDGFELAATTPPEPSPMDAIRGGKAAAAARRRVIPGSGQAT